MIGASPGENRAGAYVSGANPPCGFAATRIARRDEPAVARPGDRADVEGFEILQHCKPESLESAPLHVELLRKLRKRSIA